jgi:hypothetical protein
MPGDWPVAEDYDGDGLSDYAVYRPSEGKWYILKNSGAVAGGGVEVVSWGGAGDVPVPADYDGDGEADEAVFRSIKESGGAKWFLRLNSSSEREIDFGLLGDIPVPADFDGDGEADLAVFRPGSAEWFVRSSIDEEVSQFAFGLPGDLPLAVDVDGDGKADRIVYRPTEAKYYVSASSGSSASGQAALGVVGNRAAGSGLAARTDKAVPLDFNGDRISDLVVARKGDDDSLGFYFSTGNSLAHPRSYVSLGNYGDTAVHGDFDGDLVSDLGVVQSEAGLLYWHFLLSSEQGERRTERILAYGLEGDQVLPADFDGDGRTDLNVVRDMPDGGKLWIPNASGVSPISPVSWGLAGDYAFSSDVDGDNRSDFVIVRRVGSELWWFIRTVSGEVLQTRAYGFASDVPLIADFNGDSRGDLTVIRELNGYKMVIVDGLSPYYWGLFGDTPLWGNYLPGASTVSAVWRLLGGQGFYFVRGFAEGKPFGVVGDLPLNPYGVTQTAGGGDDGLGGDDSGGEDSGGGTGPRLNCATRTSVSAQESGFVWKPVSESDGRLVVLFGSSRAGNILRAALVEEQTAGDVVLETLNYVGDTNGGRPTFRASKPGAQYPSRLILVRQELDQTVHCIDVSSPGQRVG